MNESKHTPGPWSIDDDEGPILYDGMLRPVWNIHGGGFADGRLVCSVEHFKDDDHPNANARLIAAAPDLLETLDPQVLDFAADSFDRLQAAPRIAEALRDMAANQRAAIAKATGQ